MWECSLSTYTGGDGEVESSRALCKKKDAKHEDRRRREWTVVFCVTGLRGFEPLGAQIFYLPPAPAAWFQTQNPHTPAPSISFLIKL